MLQNIKDTDPKQRSLFSVLLYRFSQFVGFLLNVHIFSTILLAFALYVSTFFLFNKVDSLRDFVFDYKVHSIIFSALLSVLAGRIINQFYDQEKDALAEPFKMKFQQFLKQYYYLYTYLIFNILSLVLAILVSYRVLIFFLIYQFLIWLYSHKLSKILILNNLTFVALTLYPFFGVLVYYRTFSVKIFLLAIFLFLVLWILDIVKDFLTKNVDKIFEYQTLPNTFENGKIKYFVGFLFLLLMGISVLIINEIQTEFITMRYFQWSLIIAFIGIVLSLKSMKYNWLIILNLLRIWIFVGIIFMLVDGFLTLF